VLAAVAQGGCALAYASTELQDDREVVLMAVTQNGEALQHASTNLKDDREVVLVAVAQRGRALDYATARMQNDNVLIRLRDLELRTSVTLLAAELRLRVAYVGDGRCCGITKCLPSELVESIGLHCTVGMAIHGLVCQQVEGVPCAA
jgi:hypothetical protein